MMQESNFLELVEVLKVSITPVTVISGVGLLLLSMTNRYGRAIDRIRIIIKELNLSSDQIDKDRLLSQIKILFQRAKTLKLVILFSALSIFLIVLNIFFLFAIQIFKIPIESFALLGFLLSLFCLIISLILFLYEISLSLKALKLEVKTVLVL